MRHVKTLFACALAPALLSASPALAVPMITSKQVTGSALSEEGLTISVTAVDPDAAVNAIRLSFGDGEGAFGESACRIGRDGEPEAAGSLGPGRSVRFDVPFRPTLSGEHQVSITVVSGACGGDEQVTSVVLPVGVDVPGLPTAPDPGLPPLLPLPPLARISATCPDADLVPDATNLKRVRAAALCLVNAERTSRGLPALRTSKVLRRAATRHSKDMVARRFFDHEGPKGPTLPARLKKVRYWPATASENLGAGDGVFSSPALMIDAWMHSSSHRTNILTARFRQAGFGIVPSTPQGGAGATYTADFGRR
jgi:uncharacterized protein YkwD